MSPISSSCGSESGGRRWSPTRPGAPCIASWFAGLGLRLDLRRARRAAVRLGGASQQERLHRLPSTPASRGSPASCIAALSRHRDGTRALVRRGIAGGAVAGRGGGGVLMILVWLIVIPLVGGMLAWLAARWSTRCLRAGSRCCHRRRPRPGRAVSGSATAPVPQARATGSQSWTGTGSPSSAFTSTWRRRPQPAPAAADGLPGHPGGAGLLDGNPGAASASSTSTCCGCWRGSSGVFLAVDLFLFYFFWELMLVPMYFLIAHLGPREPRLRRA